MPFLRDAPGGCTLALRAAPGAPRCALVRDGDRLKARIDAPPVDGEANARLLRFLAREVFGVPVAAVALVSGERGREKVVSVALDRPAAAAALARALDPA